MNIIDQVPVIAAPEFAAIDQNRLVSAVKEATPELMSEVEASSASILQPSHSSQEVRLWFRPDHRLGLVHSDKNRKLPVGL